MTISEVRADAGYTYAMVAAVDGRGRLFRVQRATGAVQLESYDRRRGRFWRRIRSELAESIRLAIAETQRQERLDEAIAQSTSASRRNDRG